MHPLDSPALQFDIGDLVRFIGYHYSPDYYYPAENQTERGLGIVIGGIKSPVSATTWLYRVYWFKSKETTETIAAHLTRAKRKK